MLRRLLPASGSATSLRMPTASAPLNASVTPPVRTAKYYHHYKQAEQNAHYKGQFAKVIKWPGVRINRWAGEKCTAVSKNKIFQGVMISRSQAVRCPGTMIYVKRSRNVLIDAEEYRAQLPHPLASIEVV